ncbi:MAG: hypothetical protein OXH70_17440 [Acidobacteria bacterium]|nr:hypothetical protein [Acidobacteriota bacterium]
MGGWSTVDEHALRLPEGKRELNKVRLDGLTRWSLSMFEGLGNGLCVEFTVARFREMRPAQLVGLWSAVDEPDADR